MEIGLQYQHEDKRVAKTTPIESTKRDGLDLVYLQLLEDNTAYSAGIDALGGQVNDLKAKLKDNQNEAASFDSKLVHEEGSLKERIIVLEGLLKDFESPDYIPDSNNKKMIEYDAKLEKANKEINKFKTLLEAREIELEKMRKNEDRASYQSQRDSNGQQSSTTPNEDIKKLEIQIKEKKAEIFRLREDLVKAQDPNWIELKEELEDKAALIKSLERDLSEFRSKYDEVVKERDEASIQAKELKENLERVTEEYQNQLNEKHKRIESLSHPNNQQRGNEQELAELRLRAEKAESQLRNLQNDQTSRNYSSNHAIPASTTNPTIIESSDRRLIPSSQSSVPENRSYNTTPVQPIENRQYQTQPSIADTRAYQTQTQFNQTDNRLNPTYQPLNSTSIPSQTYQTTYEPRSYTTQPLISEPRSYQTQPFQYSANTQIPAPISYTNQPQTTEYRPFYSPAPAQPTEYRSLSGSKPVERISYENQTSYTPTPQSRPPVQVTQPYSSYPQTTHHQPASYQTPVSSQRETVLHQPSYAHPAPSTYTTQPLNQPTTVISSGSTAQPFITQYTPRKSEVHYLDTYQSVGNNGHQYTVQPATTHYTGQSQPQIQVLQPSTLTTPTYPNEPYRPGTGPVSERPGVYSTTGDVHRPQNQNLTSSPLSGDLLLRGSPIGVRDIQQSNMPTSTLNLPDPQYRSSHVTDPSSENLFKIIVENFDKIRKETNPQTPENSSISYTDSPSVHLFKIILENSDQIKKEMGQQAQHNSTSISEPSQIDPKTSNNQQSDEKRRTMSQLIHQYKSTPFSESQQNELISMMLENLDQNTRETNQQNKEFRDIISKQEKEIKILGLEIDKLQNEINILNSLIPKEPENNDDGTGFVLERNPDTVRQQRNVIKQQEEEGKPLNESALGESTRKEVENSIIDKLASRGPEDGELAHFKKAVYELSQELIKKGETLRRTEQKLEETTRIHAESESLRSRVETELNRLRTSNFSNPESQSRQGVQDSTGNRSTHEGVPQEQRPEEGEVERLKSIVNILEETVYARDTEIRNIRASLLDDSRIIQEQTGSHQQGQTPSDRQYESILPSHRSDPRQFDSFQQTPLQSQQQSSQIGQLQTGERVAQGYAQTGQQGDQRNQGQQQDLSQGGQALFVHQATQGYPQTGQQQGYVAVPGSQSMLGHQDQPLEHRDTLSSRQSELSYTLPYNNQISGISNTGPYGHQDSINSRQPQEDGARIYGQSPERTENFVRESTLQSHSESGRVPENHDAEVTMLKSALRQHLKTINVLSAKIENLEIDKQEILEADSQSKRKIILGKIKNTIKAAHFLKHNHNTPSNSQVKEQIQKISDLSAEINAVESQVSYIQNVLERSSIEEAIQTEMVISLNRKIRQLENENLMTSSIEQDKVALERNLEILKRALDTSTDRLSSITDENRELEKKNQEQVEQLQKVLRATHQYVSEIKRENQSKRIETDPDEVIEVQAAAFEIRLENLEMKLEESQRLLEENAKSMERRPEDLRQKDLLVSLSRHIRDLEKKQEDAPHPSVDSHTRIYEKRNSLESTLNECEKNLKAVPKEVPEIEKVNGEEDNLELVEKVKQLETELTRKDIEIGIYNEQIGIYEGSMREVHTLIGLLPGDYFDKILEASPVKSLGTVGQHKALKEDTELVQARISALVGLVTQEHNEKENKNEESGAINEVDEEDEEKVDDEKVELRMQILLLKDNLEERTEELNIANAKLHDVERDFKIQEAHLARLRSQIEDNTNQDTKEPGESIDDLRLKNKFLTAQVDDRVEEVKAVNSNLASRIREIEQLENDLKDTEGKLEEAKRNVTEANNRAHDYERKYNESHNKHAELLKKVEKTQEKHAEDLDNLNNLILMLKSELEDRINEVKTSNESLDQTKKKLNESEEALKGIQTGLESLRTEREDLIRKVEELESRLRTATLSSSSDISGEKSKIETEWEKINEEKHSIREDRVKLEDQWRNISIEMQKLKDEKTATERFQEEVLNKNEMRLRKISESDLTPQDTKILGKLESDIVNLKEEKSRANKKYKELEMEKNQQDIEFMELKRENKRMKERIDKVEKNSAELKKEIQKSNDKAKKLEKELEELEEQNKSLKIRANTVQNPYALVESLTGEQSKLSIREQAAPKNNDDDLVSFEVSATTFGVDKKSQINNNSKKQEKSSIGNQDKYSEYEVKDPESKKQESGNNKREEVRNRKISNDANSWLEEDSEDIPPQKSNFNTENLFESLQPEMTSSPKEKDILRKSKDSGVDSSSKRSKTDKGSKKLYKSETVGVEERGSKRSVDHSRDKDESRKGSKSKKSKRNSDYDSEYQVKGSSKYQDEESYQPSKKKDQSRKEDGEYYRKKDTKAEAQEEANLISETGTFGGSEIIESPQKSKRTKKAKVENLVESENFGIKEEPEQEERGTDEKFYSKSEATKLLEPIQEEKKQDSSKVKEDEYVVRLDPFIHLEDFKTSKKSEVERDDDDDDSFIDVRDSSLTGVNIGAFEDDKEKEKREEEKNIELKPKDLDPSNIFATATEQQIKKKKKNKKKKSKKLSVEIKEINEGDK